jgi:hypothetical protein
VLFENISIKEMYGVGGRSETEIFLYSSVKNLDLPMKLLGSYNNCD